MWHACLLNALCGSSEPAQFAASRRTMAKQKLKLPNANESLQDMYSILFEYEGRASPRNHIKYYWSQRSAGTSDESVAINCCSNYIFTDKWRQMFIVMCPTFSHPTQSPIPLHLVLFVISINLFALSFGKCTQAINAKQVNNMWPVATVRLNRKWLLCCRTPSINNFRHWRIVTAINIVHNGRDSAAFVALPNYFRIK